MLRFEPALCGRNQLNPDGFQSDISASAFLKVLLRRYSVFESCRQPSLYDAGQRNIGHRDQHDDAESFR